jgi:hypothetical protein
MLLSTSAFKSNLRRYTEQELALHSFRLHAAAARRQLVRCMYGEWRAFTAEHQRLARLITKVGRCRLTLSNPHGKRLDLRA